MIFVKDNSSKVVDFIRLMLQSFQIEELKQTWTFGYYSMNEAGDLFTVTSSAVRHDFGDVLV